MDSLKDKLKKLSLLSGSGKAKGAFQGTGQPTSRWRMGEAGLVAARLPAAAAQHLLSLSQRSRQPRAAAGCQKQAEEVRMRGWKRVGVHSM